MTWLDQARAVPLLDVLAALSIRTMPRNTYGPCPSCGAETRGKEDRRGPLGLGSSRIGWRCHRCDASGDGIKAAALRTGDLQAARAWYADRGWCDAAPGYIARPVPPPPQAPPPRPPPPPPDPAELAALLSHCLPADPSWLDRRMVPSLPGLVGRLPHSAPLPPWARYMGRPWTETGHTALVPCWGPGGDLQGIRARAPGARPAGSPKALPPSGRTMPKAMMANPTARAWLRGGPAPKSVVLVEGEPAWVLWSVRCADVAVLGFVSGSWSEAWAERINAADAPVLLVTDHDPAGDRYAANMAGTLRRAYRWPFAKDATEPGDRTHNEERPEL